MNVLESTVATPRAEIRQRRVSRQILVVAIAMLVGFMLAFFILRQPYAVVDVKTVVKTVRQCPVMAE
jgi:predicted histidine transporter YuiF (NhaC family)